MTKRFKSTGLALGVCAVAILLVFQMMAGSAYAGGYALSGVGSKAIAMGGAFRGLADDWSAAYWNPAGLTQLEESEFNSMLVILNPRPEYTPDITFGGLDVGYRNGEVLYPDNGAIFVPDVSGFFKFDNWEHTTVGVGIFVPIGFNSKWDLYNPTPQMDIRNSFPLWDHEGDLAVIDIHPAIARSFMEDKLSLGFGVSFLRGDITLGKTALLPSGFPVPHENFLIQTELKGDGWGFGVNFGMMYEFSDKFQFGISGKLPSTLSLSGSASQELYTMDNDEFKNILLSQSGNLADSMRVLALFSSGNLYAEPDAEAEFDIPGDVGFGIAVSPTEKLTFTGEVAYTYWSGVDSVVLEMDGFGPSGAPAENSTIMFDWENTLRFSLGGEYYMFDPLAIRFGYYFDPSPVPDRAFTPLIPDMGNKNSYNIGGGLHLGSFELAYNYEYISFEDRMIEALEDVNQDGAFDNYPGDFKMSLHASHISFTYRF